MIGVSEQPVLFTVHADTLVGVLATPESGAVRCGVVIVVGGPQYRAGSHRHFVTLSRVLASSGHAVLRFDARGMGDSEGKLRPFTELDDDISGAICALVNRHSGVQKIVLWGLCDGASAALMYWHRCRDPRVSAMCLVNPWLRSEAGRARTQVRHYYMRRLLDVGFWRKLLRGSIGISALGDLLRNVRRSVQREGQAQSSPRGLEGSFRDLMAAAWEKFPGPILLLLSGNDFTAKEFIDGVSREPAWNGAWARENLLRVDLPGADHTLSATQDSRACEQALLSWLSTQVSRATENGGLPCTPL